jgi:predicted nucleotidyltransferase
LRRRKGHARSVRVFSSVRSQKGLDKAGSNLDLLMNLARGTSLPRIVGLRSDIDDALGVKVLLCTETARHPDLKTRRLAEARPP